MGGKDERMLVQKYIDMGFGAYRYPQPAITMDKKYQKPGFEKVRRQQPVDLIVNAILNVTYPDGTNRKFPFRLGVEQKTTSKLSYTKSNYNTKSFFKFINFCKRNCLIPAYIIIFREYDEYKYGFHFGDEPKQINGADAYEYFSELVQAQILEYIKVYDELSSKWTSIDIELSEADLNEGIETN